MWIASLSFLWTVQLMPFTDFENFITILHPLWSNVRKYSKFLVVRRFGNNVIWMNHGVIIVFKFFRIILFFGFCVVQLLIPLRELPEVFQEYSCNIMMRRFRRDILCVLCCFRHLFRVHLRNPKLKSLPKSHDTNPLGIVPTMKKPFGVSQSYAVPVWFY